MKYSGEISLSLPTKLLFIGQHGSQIKHEKAEDVKKIDNTPGKIHLSEF